MPYRPAPPTASFAEIGVDGRMHAPSAARNAEPILALLRQYGPAAGSVLELASGTGQHAVEFARALPGLDWQPSDIDPARLASIAAWAASANLVNLRAPVSLDATRPGWSAAHGGKSLVLLVNLLHLVSAAEARTLVSETARALAPGGRFILYGPFLRGGATTSEGDARFHASLIAQDPEIGYKDDAEVTCWLRAAGMNPVGRADMPANNLAFVAERPAEPVP